MVFCAEAKTNSDDEDRLSFPASESWRLLRASAGAQKTYPFRAGELKLCKDSRRSRVCCVSA